MTRAIMIMAASLILFSGCALRSSPPAGPAENAPAQPPAEHQRYTFSRQLNGDNDSSVPRGGTTKGAPVTLDTGTNAARASLRKPGISKFERDRRAILALAGDYRVTFDFVETVPLRDGYEPGRPYQSWATEFIEVIEDEGNFISLQHVLVMYTEDDEGNIQGPFVSKHWRQDWTYEDRRLVRFTGNNTWVIDALTPEESKGKWTQAVYQVDDAPRYEASAEWVHDGNYSRWTSSDTWRPLPRREFSVRDDYSVLMGVNRIVITPQGWAHEQENVKLAVDGNGQPVGDEPYIAKEVGVNLYERITGTDFGEGRAYWKNTAPFWKDVREAWAGVISYNGSFTLKSEYDGRKLYEYLFEYADTIGDGGYDHTEGSNFAKETINKFVVRPGASAGGTVY